MILLIIATKVFARSSQMINYPFDLQSFLGILFMKFFKHHTIISQFVKKHYLAVAGLISK